MKDVVKGKPIPTQSFLSKDVLIRFYKYICEDMHFTGFKNLNEERIEDLEKVMNKELLRMNKYNFSVQNIAAKIAERLTVANKSMGVENGDEAAYIYINAVDKDLNVFKKVCTSNNMKDVKEYCILQYGWFDKYLVKLEKYYNEKFNLFDAEELYWNMEEENAKRGV